MERVTIRMFSYIFKVAETLAQTAFIVCVTLSL